MRTAQLVQTVAGRRARLRLYGLVFVLALGLLLGLSVAVYKKTFVRVVAVQLQTDTVGNQLSPPADVKLHGVVVGEVRAVHADGRRATVDLALTPRYVPAIPANVQARLLPKTLFGERYVSLEPPARPAGRHIRAGDVITQDRSSTAVELEKVFADLLPLLRSVPAGKLNAALSAIADALEGRGEAIGANLERVEAYVRALGPHVGTLTTDISLLADVASTYADAAPDLLATARNLVTTSRTVVAKADTLAGFLADVSGLASRARAVLAANGDRVIALARVSRPTLALLARYAPEYPCLLAGLAAAEPRLEDTLAGGALHITLEAVLPREGYRPGEEPRYGEHSGPSCRGLPSPAVPAPAVKLDDGTTGNREALPPLLSGLPAPLRGSLATPSSSMAGTAAEQRVVGALLAPALDRPAGQVPPVATLLFGPLARGTAVSVS